LPTGNVKDKLNVPNLDEITFSIIDIANPTVFVKAEDLGLDGIELPGDFKEV
jgi:2-methylaconitate cis-trans-isomerase PrpF